MSTAYLLTFFPQV